MTISQKAVKTIVFLVATISTIQAQALDTMTKQQHCSTIVKSNMAATSENKPDVMKTIKGYFFEYSPSRDSCVEIVQYNVRKSGKPHQVQILAYNAITQQPMEGYKNIFLEDANDSKVIQDATNFLFERYSY